MIILAFEGLDKAGKRSQADLLYQALLERGFKVEKSGFHRYDTPTGQLIRRFLDGEYQPGQLAMECIMTADKYAQREWILSLAETTDVLILDRYVLSQCVYSMANGINIEFTSSLLQYLPEPDFHFYLDIDPETSMERKGEHGDNDKYESNHALLETVQEYYLKYMYVDVHLQKGLILDGNQSPEDIHQLILAETLSLLGKEEAA